MLEVSKATKRAIHAHAYRDIRPSVAVVNGKAAFAVISGGGVSLAACAAFDIALTDAAQTTMSSLEALSSPTLALAAGGAVFALFPVVMLRLICGGMQFRSLARRRPLSLIAWTACFGLALSWLSQGSVDGPALLCWLAGATIGYRVWADVVDRLHWRRRERGATQRAAAVLLR